MSDIGVGHVGIVYPRAQIIDYTTFTYYLEVGHKTRKPIPISPIFNIFSPYSYDLWIALSIAILVASVGKKMKKRFLALDTEFTDFKITDFLA